jgi:hypothetical protein
MADNYRPNPATARQLAVDGSLPGTILAVRQQVIGSGSDSRTGHYRSRTRLALAGRRGFHVFFHSASPASHARLTTDRHHASAS